MAAYNGPALVKPFEVDPDPADAEIFARFCDDVRRRFPAKVTVGKTIHRVSSYHLHYVWHVMRGVTDTKDLCYLLCIEPSSLKNALNDLHHVTGSRSRPDLVRVLWPSYLFAWRQLPGDVAPRG